MITLCPHGISHQPGEPDEEGRSVWCAECYPEEPDSARASWRAADEDRAGGRNTLTRFADTDRCTPVA